MYVPEWWKSTARMLREWAMTRRCVGGGGAAGSGGSPSCALLREDRRVVQSHTCSSGPATDQPLAGQNTWRFNPITGGMCTRGYGNAGALGVEGERNDAVLVASAAHALSERHVPHAHLAAEAAARQQATASRVELDRPGRARMADEHVFECSALRTCVTCVLRVLDIDEQVHCSGRS